MATPDLGHILKDHTDWLFRASLKKILTTQPLFYGTKPANVGARSVADAGKTTAVRTVTRLRRRLVSATRSHCRACVHRAVPRSRVQGSRGLFYDHDFTTKLRTDATTTAAVDGARARERERDGPTLDEPSVLCAPFALCAGPSVLWRAPPTTTQHVRRRRSNQLWNNSVPPTPTTPPLTPPPPPPPRITRSATAVRAQHARTHWPAYTHCTPRKHSDTL